MKIVKEKKVHFLTTIGAQKGVAVVCGSIYGRKPTEKEATDKLEFVSCERCAATEEYKKLAKNHQFGTFKKPESKVEEVPDEEMKTSEVNGEIGIIHDLRSVNADLIDDMKSIAGGLHEGLMLLKDGIEVLEKMIEKIGE